MNFPRKEALESSDLEQWQIEEIEKGLAEADRGEFASAEEVEQVLKRWTNRRALGKPDEARGAIRKN